MQVLPSQVRGAAPRWKTTAPRKVTGLRRWTWRRRPRTCSLSEGSLNTDGVGSAAPRTLEGSHTRPTRPWPWSCGAESCPGSQSRSDGSTAVGFLTSLWRAVPHRRPREGRLSPHFADRETETWRGPCPAQCVALSPRGSQELPPAASFAAEAPPHPGPKVLVLMALGGCGAVSELSSWL